MSENDSNISKKVGDVAQLVERSPEEAGVSGSNPFITTFMER